MQMVILWTGVILTLYGYALYHDRKSSKAYKAMEEATKFIRECEANDDNKWKAIAWLDQVEDVVYNVSTERIFENLKHSFLIKFNEKWETLRVQ